MKKAKRYRLSRYGTNLLKVRATVGGLILGEYQQVTLLIDTGSSYTILPIRVLTDLGYDLRNPLRRQSLITGQGITPLLPVINVNWLNCVGQFIENFEVIAYTIPQSLQVNGLLGMDFLGRCQAILSTAEAEIFFQND